MISFFHSILTLLAATKKKEKTNKQTNKMSDDNVLVVWHTPVSSNGVVSRNIQYMHENVLELWKKKEKKLCSC